MCQTFLAGLHAGSAIRLLFDAPVVGRYLKMYDFDHSTWLQDLKTGFAMEVYGCPAGH